MSDADQIKTIERLRGTLEYILAQARQGYPTVLSVIKANAAAALDDDWQETVAKAFSTLKPEGEQALSLPVSNTGEWQPIETAPRDGTPILGWNSTFGARETKSITYLPGSPGHADGRTDRWWNWEEMHQATRWHPTHWQPLPEAPNE